MSSCVRCGCEHDTFFKLCPLCRKREREYERDRNGYKPMAEDRKERKPRSLQLLEAWEKNFAPDPEPPKRHRCYGCIEGTFINQRLYYCRLPEGYCIRGKGGEKH